VIGVFIVHVECWSGLELIRLMKDIWIKPWLWLSLGIAVSWGCSAVIFAKCVRDLGAVEAGGWVSSSVGIIAGVILCMSGKRSLADILIPMSSAWVYGVSLMVTLAISHRAQADL